MPIVSDLIFKKVPLNLKNQLNLLRGATVLNAQTWMSKMEF